MSAAKATCSLSVSSVLVGFGCLVISTAQATCSLSLSSVLVGFWCPVMSTAQATETAKLCLLNKGSTLDAVVGKKKLLCLLDKTLVCTFPVAVYSRTPFLLLLNNIACWTRVHLPCAIVHSSCHCWTTCLLNKSAPSLSLSAIIYCTLPVITEQLCLVDKSAPSLSLSAIVHPSCHSEQLCLLDKSTPSLSLSALVHCSCHCWTTLFAGQERTFPVTFCSSTHFLSLLNNFVCWTRVHLPCHFLL